MKPTHFVFTKTTLAAAAAGVLLFVAVRAQAPAPTPRVHAQVTVPTAAARSVAGPSVAQRVPLDEIYDASVYAYGKSYCSATLVGPRALVTAGHCLDSDGTPLRIMFGVRSEQYVGVCARPDTFKQIDSATFVDDVALCTLDRDVLGVPFDVVDFDQRPEETPVSLTGFGCDPTDMSPAAKIAQLRSG